ncbi:hypothetical protein KFU94_53590 [Chloroflexi bacterium TSY]|nr:hypothetical protein [Chloroflexi bacterium TSY]
MNVKRMVRHKVWGMGNGGKLVDQIETPYTIMLRARLKTNTPTDHLAVKAELVSHRLICFIIHADQLRGKRIALEK